MRPMMALRTQHKHIDANVRLLNSRRVTVARSSSISAGAAATSTSGSSTYKPLVKVCGVTNPADAEVAAKAGADFVGMIMWPKAKRSVSDVTAAAIAAAARKHGAEPVGVFVDEDAATITARCKAAGIRLAQLHGDGARASLAQLPTELGVVYVLHASPAGELLTPVPQVGAEAATTTAGGGGAAAAASSAAAAAARASDWLLVDGQTGGSGETYDWTALRAPAGAARGWLLAGGLHPGNVAEAVAIARPTGVDVSSGVCGPDGLAKDAAKVEAFVAAAVGAGQGGR